MYDRRFFPGVMTARDIEVMREAVQIVIDGDGENANHRNIARIAFEFYRGGVTDPHRLAEITAFVGSSRAFGRIDREHVARILGK